MLLAEGFDKIGRDKTRRAEIFGQLSAYDNSSDAEILYYLGKATEEGWGGKKKLRTAQSFYKKAAKQDHAPALTALAILYRQGIGTNVALTSYTKTIKQAIALGYAPAKTDYATVLATGNKKQQKQAYKLAGEAAEAGDKAGVYALANMTEQGIGREANLNEALSLYEKAAEAGDWQANLRLGKAYANGEGVEKELARAYQFYLASARVQRTGEALVGIARILETGANGIEADPARAKKYYERVFKMRSNNDKVSYNIARKALLRL